MLSNNTFLENRIQLLLDGLIFVEKGLGVHVQRMLKMSRGLYTGGNFKQNTWKKAKENWGPYLFCLFVFVALRPKSTAMVIVGRSVHLITLFPGQA